MPRHEGGSRRALLACGLVLRFALWRGGRGRVAVLTGGDSWRSVTSFFMRARFSHAIAASLLVTLWIATPLLAVVHEALEMHSFCVQHERLEEGGDRHGQPQTGAAESEASEDSSMQAGGSEGPSGDAHAPCSFDESFTRTCVTGPGAPAVGVLAQAAAVALPPSHASAVLAIDLLRLAPKNSPPRSC